MIPAEARAVFNIRFNDEHTGKSLEQWLRREFAAAGGRFDLAVQVSGEAFLTPPGRCRKSMARASRRSPA